MAFLRQNTFVMLSLCLMLIVASGCGSEKNGPSDKANSGPQAKNEGKAGRKYRIAVIPKGTTHQFWKSIHAGALQAEAELGNVEIIWKGSVREDDREQQIAVVEGFVNAGVDAIVLAPLDRKSLVAPVRLAKQRGIPVVIIDSTLDAPDLIASYVATNNVAGGALAAKHMGTILKGKGNVVVLRYQVGSASTEQRESGFLEALAKDFPEMKVVSSEQYSGATREEALAKAENLITRLEGKIDGWFCCCEPVTFGTLRAFQQKNLLGKVTIVGFDSSDEMVDALRKEHVHGLILQDPINMGYLGVKTAADVLAGKSVPKEISTGENLITKANMDEPKSKQLHSPDLKKWLKE